ncbi:hypothetical protein Taro_026524 [Colocasia esculenta]|uniref:Uncharacterized protein n=1 Tax=Colocasia esculenta TaxID=4460 RepID=A0A843VBM3_COLES|nr:hypothetical protein [Colocasia esculenta]
MASAAAFASSFPVGPAQWRPHQLTSPRLRACSCHKLFLLASGGFHGCWPRRGGRRRLGLPVLCSGKGRGESGVLDGARREEALGGGDSLGAAGEEEGEVAGNLLGSGDKEEQGKWRPPWEILPQRYRLIGTTSLAFVVCNMDKTQWLESIFWYIIKMDASGALVFFPSGLSRANALENKWSLVLR